MADVRIASLAKNDLLEIKDYIADELSSPGAALKTVAQITARIRELSKFPDLGASLEAIIDIRTDYRYLVCENYTVFYRHEEKGLVVTRVLYGGRDFMKILFG